MYYLYWKIKGKKRVLTIKNNTNEAAESSNTIEVGAPSLK